MKALTFNRNEMVAVHTRNNKTVINQLRGKNEIQISVIQQPRGLPVGSMLDMHMIITKRTRSCGMEILMLKNRHEK